MPLDEAVLEESMMKFSMAFEEQFHYGCFYAYLKIKEQEIKNITWLADLITMGADRSLPGWNKVIVPFMYHANDEKDINQWKKWQGLTGQKVIQFNIKLNEKHAI